LLGYFLFIWTGKEGERMIKILHTEDLHLGRDFPALGDKGR
jgi:hypothetical protein